MASRSEAGNFYDRTAEYVAVLFPAAWEAPGSALTNAVAGLDTNSGTLVEVGARSRVGTAALARSLPGGTSSPSSQHRALRAALLARVAGDEQLRHRVTVLDRDLLSATLPRTCCGLVLMNVIGHFTPAGRREVWALLADRLAPEGPAVLNLYPPTWPEKVSASPMAAVRLGRRCYTDSCRRSPPTRTR